MSVEDVDTGNSETDKRLDETMSPEDKPSETSSAVLADDGRLASPLTTLKSIVLSMDWEISDAILTEFILELNRLKTVLKDDAIVVKCIQLLEAIGKYILQKKAQTHPDSIRLLQSIYRDLEILLLSKGISETARRNILADEIAQFKKLKEKLTGPFKPTSGDYSRNLEKSYGFSSSMHSEPTSQHKAVTGYETMPPHEAFRVAIEEIKKIIQAEFDAIRAELKLWRKER